MKRPSPADDALDADGERILDYAQGKTKARSWLASLYAEGKADPTPSTAVSMTTSRLQTPVEGARPSRNHR